MSEIIYEIFVSIRCLDSDRAPESESEVSFWRSNVEFLGASKFPVSKCRFHPRTRGDVGLLLCRHFGSLRVSFALVYSFSSAVVFSYDFFPFEAFQPLRE